MFASDNAAYPYGVKREQVLIERVLLVVEQLLESYCPNILVVACNTASTVTLPYLREKYDLPIVGVVPAIKPAAMLSQTRHIALLATPATIQRSYTNQLIEQFAYDCHVHRFGSAYLVELAEQKMQGHMPTDAQLETCLSPLLEVSDIDVIVLACTHFPLLKQEIKAFFKAHNRSVQLLDSGDAIANRVSDLVQKQACSTPPLSAESCTVLTKQVDLNADFEGYLTNVGLGNNIDYLML